MSWIFGVLVFFSFSNSKLISYILPVVQPIAFITGVAVANFFDSTKNKDFDWCVWTTVALFAIAFVIYLFARSEIADVLENYNASLLINMLFGLMFFIVVALIYALSSRISKFLAVLLGLFLSANMMWVINKASVFYQNVKKPTTKHFAELINLNKKNEDLVFCYNRYYQDFPVYLGSTVGVVDFVGELEFGANAEQNNDKLITKDKFWDLWNTTNKKIFLLLSRNDYRETFVEKNVIHKILDFNKYFVVIMNK
jgi:4-amino-4-deoxy-L-arabinose transferase-like glycosyltransferase